ncbi:MAG TPA: ATP-binding protein [Kofleriaceae bacterium]|nr:ATP-binding protein [Kofleriaceae bacterium]
MKDRSNDLVLVLSETFRAFAEATTDYATLLDTVARKLTELIGDACIVSLAAADGSWRDLGAACASDETATRLLRASLANRPERDGTGQSIRVALTGQPVIIPTIAPDELARRAEPAFAQAVRDLAVHGFLSVPLVVRDRPLGVLSLLRYLVDSPPFDERDQALAQSVADHAALAIANAQLFDELKLAEEQAKTFVALVENSSDMIGMADFAGRVLFLNASGRELLGLPADHDVRTNTLKDFHAPDDLARVYEHRQLGHWRGEAVLRHQQTGERIVTEASTFMVRDASGAPLCFGTVQHDLRATKRLEAELRQAQKMEALGRLAGGIAHDFNNLLTVILSYSAMLQHSLPKEGRNIGDIQQIDRAAQRAAQLTRQLLAFSRRQVLELKPLDLGAAVQSMSSMIRRLIGEDIELRIITEPGVGAVMVDAGQIEQVVMNLVVNARDAMTVGGVLTLETASVLLDDGKPGLTLSITDTGTGIDEATKTHVFDPFFTTKEHGKGTGLGLSTVMGIVEQSGGHVSVDSELGRGTTFRVTLPVTDRDPSQPIAIARTATPLHGTQRILVVEDEVDVRVLIREILSQAGYEVIDAADGLHALTVAASVSGEIDLLLTDVIMPKLSGRELAKRFIKLRPETRVLYMSGYTDDKLGHHGLLDPDIELIQKPLTPDELLRRVRRLLA